jgi:hypothetical protein
MSAVGAGEEVVPASEYRALQSQVRELQRLLGKKTLDNEMLREVWDQAQPEKRNTKPAASSPRLKTAASAAAVSVSGNVNTCSHVFTKLHQWSSMLSA